MMTSDSISSNAAAGHPAYGARLAALEVVFGDLGTSPLYTLQTVVQAVGGRFTPASATGILSLFVWTLIITISVKYCVFVMRADNRGEGGILALMSLIGGARRCVSVHHRRRGLVRRYGPLRQRPDPLVLVLGCAAGTSIELRGANRIRD
jgi:K+ transporter